MAVKGKGSHLCCFGLLLATLVLMSCDTPSTSFDSDAWKRGNSTTRGAMSQDLIDRKLLIGKPRSEIDGLLGKPDYQEADWYGYKVITIARCRYVWECRFDVNFDAASGRVKSVAVSD